MIAQELIRLGREMAALNKQVEEMALGRMVEVRDRRKPFKVERIQIDMETGVIRLGFHYDDPAPQRIDRVVWLDDEEA